MQELVIVLFLTGDNGSAGAGCNNSTGIPPFDLKQLIEPSKQGGVATRFQEILGPAVRTRRYQKFVSAHTHGGIYHENGLRSPRRLVSKEQSELLYDINLKFKARLARQQANKLQGR